MDRQTGLAGFALALLLALPVGPAAATPLADGMAALRAGDYATARQLLQPLAEQGNAEAQYRVASMHALGQGVPEDQAAAAAWYTRAAEQGHHEAALTLGNMYLSGLGVPRDEAAAVRWLERAAAIAAMQQLDQDDCE